VEAQRDLLLARTLDIARRAPFWSDRIDANPNLITEKEVWRDAPEEDRLTAAPPRGTLSIHTSGSTGEPIKVFYSPRGAWFQGVLSLRMARHQGLAPWSRLASVDVRRSMKGAGLLGSIRRRLVVDVPVEAAAGEILRMVQRMRPTAMGGHSLLLVEVGEALAGRYRPRVLLTNGGTLTADDRQALRRLFGVEPIDIYGTSECGVVAWQCSEADLYHVNHEAVAVEIVDNTGLPVAPGEIGDVLLTSMWNPLMPFVRYRIGDAAAWSTRPCRCGSRLPALTHIAGRTFNWIVDANGRRLAPQRLLLSIHLGSRGSEGVRRYCVRQDSSRRVRVDIVPNERGFSEQDAAALKTSYRRLLGELEVEVRTVTRLETTPGAKFETIRSEATAAGDPAALGP
jgi:phenylacetate-coenzyme A ligase PaaK-like adenylate-forming protein